jgi:glycosyltransferase involved in cell wall biosynthesis
VHLPNFDKNLYKPTSGVYRRIPMGVNGVKLSSIGGVDTVNCGRCGVAECGNQDDGVEIFPAEHLGVGGKKDLSALFPNEMAASLVEKRGPTRQAEHTVPSGIFSRSPADGAPLLQAYLDKLPENERHSVFASLIQTHWKWLCKAAPYLKFPEPKPVPDGKVINIGIRSRRLTGGGLGRIMQLVANHFSDDPRYHVTLFIDKNWTKHINYPIHKNVTIVPVVSRKGYIDLDGYIQNHPQDLFVFLKSWNVGIIKNVLLSKFLGVRTLVENQMYIYFPPPFANFQENLAHMSPLYSSCDAISCLSSVDLYKWRQQEVKNSILLPNPPAFDLEAITPISHQTKNILWVGRWDPGQKRPIMAIKTFAKVLTKVPDARLIMLGEYDPKSACYKECKQFIEKNGIGHAVEILGFQKDMASHYANGALLLSTSRFEGFGMMISEAKAFGLPVVSTEMRYLETLKKGCIQTPKNDVDALADAVVDLLENREKRKKLGEEARRDIMEKFSDAAVFAKYEALIQAILKGSDAVRELCAQQPFMDGETAESILAEEAKIWK